MTSPESVNMLLTCLRESLTPEEQASLKTVSAETWTEIVRLALRQRLAPYLHSQLNDHHLSDLLPAEAAKRLSDAYRHSALQNLRLSKELSALLEAFGEQGIPVIVLKGAYLVYTVYKGIALRPMSDIDLLAPEADLARAVNTMHMLGYQAKHSTEPPDIMAHHLHPFYHAGNAAGVEVHWRLFHTEQLAAIPTADFWTRAFPVVLAGKAALALSPEDLLLHVCCHGIYGHRMNIDARFLVDIMLIVRHFQASLNWQVLAERARAWRCERGVYLALYLAQALLGAAVAPACFEALIPGAAGHISLETYRQLLFMRDDLQATKISGAFAQMRSERSVVGKLRLLVERILLPRSVVSYIYGVDAASPRVYWYYLVHLKNMLRRYLRIGYFSEPEFASQVQLQVEFARWLGVAEPE